jgi:hypothetical protein
MTAGEFLEGPVEGVARAGNTGGGLDDDDWV